MKHLTEYDRYFIEKSLKQKMKVADIAQFLGVHRSTIYREIKRGLCEQRESIFGATKLVYLSDYAQRDYKAKGKRKGRKRKLEYNDPYLLDVKNIILRQKYSPEATRFYLKNNKLCVKSIYNYIYDGLIEGVTIHNLLYARPRKKKNVPVSKRGYTKGESIEQRPAFINDRLKYGHWEMDTVYSSKGSSSVLLVLSERMTREELLIKLKNRESLSVLSAFNRLERQMGTTAFREKFKTITCDNGVEFSLWKELEHSYRSKRKRTAIYFCHPYSSFERGTNENINRMIRRWIPKGDDIGLYSDFEIAQIQEWINNYPRPMFGGLSSNEYRSCVS